MGTCPVLCRKCIPSGRAVAVGFVFSYQASNNEASLHAYHMDSRPILPRTFLMEDKQVLNMFKNDESQPERRTRSVMRNVQPLRF